MYKSFYTIFLAGLIFVSCSNSSGNEKLTDEEMIQGTWEVELAVIDGNSQPITNPGLGQMRLIIDGNTYTYVFPQLSESGLPNGNTDSISGDWSFNSDNSVLLLDRSSVNESDFEWDILQLSVGILKTYYEERAADGSNGTSTYEFTYSLTSD